MLKRIMNINILLLIEDVLFGLLFYYLGFRRCKKEIGEKEY